MRTSATDGAGSATTVAGLFGAGTAGQIGGATANTSKLAVVGRSADPATDVDYLFGQAATDKPTVDFSGTCGNLASAVALYAVQEGLASGRVRIREWLRWRLLVVRSRLGTVSWTLVILDEVREWLRSRDKLTRKLVGEALTRLQEEGPSLARPLVDTIAGSRLSNLKELRPGSAGRTEIRLLFVFDPIRRAVILVGGDKAGQWRRWYDVNIPLAEERYEAHLAKLKEDGS